MAVRARLDLDHSVIAVSGWERSNAFYREVLGAEVIRLESGRPVPRFGARGRGISVYFRDPDGSLLEFISYAEADRER
jgi:catechol 2,3-dioxygenase-like lactoylglutathione lyase family enzyme